MWIPPGEYILDRLEGETAVLEGEDKLWDIPRQDLPPQTAPGHVLIWDGQIWRIDQAETQARKQRMAEKMRRFFVCFLRLFGRGKRKGRRFSSLAAVFALDDFFYLFRRFPEIFRQP